jgi:glycerol-3-phosphate dehydrogenase
MALRVAQLGQTLT